MQKGASLMGKPSAIIPKKPLRLGSIVFSPSREIRKNIRSYSRLFRCRKDGFDYMGQIKIDLQNFVIKVEVFNKNYFDYFIKYSETEFTSSFGSGGSGRSFGIEGGIGVFGSITIDRHSMIMIP